ncbi:MAG: hypothetical protein JWP34_5356 [Massilia sp.]|nr:hypothetical protein [Massilia sp.]
MGVSRPRGRHCAAGAAAVVEAAAVAEAAAGAEAGLRLGQKIDKVGDEKNRMAKFVIMDCLVNPKLLSFFFC